MVCNPVPLSLMLLDVSALEHKIRMSTIYPLQSSAAETFSLFFQLRSASAGPRAYLVTRADLVCTQAPASASVTSENGDWWMTFTGSSLCCAHPCLNLLPCSWAGNGNATRLGRANPSGRRILLSTVHLGQVFVSIETQSSWAARLTTTDLDKNCLVLQ